MGVKYYIAIVDDFTSNVLNYPNVTYYDFGTESNVTYWDTWYYDYRASLTTPFDYGDIDSTFTNFSNTSYYHNSQFYGPSLQESGRLGPTLNDYDYFYNLYMLEGYNDYEIYQQLLPYNPGNDTIGHGDWTAEAFFQQLDDPSCVEFIAIDCDFTDSADFNYLFSGNVFENLINDAFYRTADPDDYNLFVGLSASFTSGGSNVAQAVDEIINSWSGFVIQSAPNVSSSGIPWGDYIPNVINVGAWNTDQNDYALASNVNYIDVVDIFADGYVQKSGWGDNFGTSFATPRVSAEMINYANDFLTPLIEDPSFVAPDNGTLTNEEITQVTNSYVDAISTEMHVLFENIPEYVGPINVLTDNVSDGSPSPTQIPYSIVDFGLRVLSSIESADLNNQNIHAVTTPSDNDGTNNTISELASIGATVGITALATDGDAADSVSYALTNDAGGLFTIDSTSGVVSLAGQLDYETATSHTITVEATSTDGSSD
ncbi:cadherin domain-containing protein, partial [Alphaproteobacteria bacterium]|nr:cadherin domain-containing protein [Alphaproteobacteria bacterium]